MLGVSILLGTLLTACSTDVKVSDQSRPSSGPDAAASAADVSASTDASNGGAMDVGFIEDARAPDTGLAPIDAGPAPGPVVGTLENWCQGQPADFSFFVTSMNAIWTLAGSQIDDLNGGFGGNFGGIAGADYICQTIAQATGFGHKRWRAFLSATDDGNGSPIHAIERIGTGPWYDSNGRLVATGLAGLAGDRPDGESASVLDLPDECGVPISFIGDAHDTVTGSDRSGRVSTTDRNFTCNDWTSSSAEVGYAPRGAPGVMIGHSFPRRGATGNGANWASDHSTRGCSKGAVITQTQSTGTCIGCAGGFGGLYCFAE